MNLLDRIRTLCNQHGISIPSLEKATGIGNGTVGRWDTSYPRADKLRDVADYFSVSMDWLMGRTLCGYSAEALEIARAFDSADDKSRALVRLALTLSFYDILANGRRFHNPPNDGRFLRESPKFGGM